MTIASDIRPKWLSGREHLFFDRHNAKWNQIENDTFSVFTQTPIAYDKALETMDSLVKKVQDDPSRGILWFLEHPHIVTFGSSAYQDREFPPTLPNNIELFHTKRGGKATYHGPGQRVVYVIINLHNYKKDVRHFVKSMEDWIIASLKTLDINAFVNDEHIGVWVEHKSDALNPPHHAALDKIAAIGVRLSKWVSSHGLSINVTSDVDIYRHFTACGIDDPSLGVTSVAKYLNALDKNKAELKNVDQALISTLPNFMKKLRHSQFKNEKG